MPTSEQLRRKADEYLRQALAEPDGPYRTHLIGKASYWNKLALAAAKEGAPRHDPWADRSLRRTA